MSMRWNHRSRVHRQGQSGDIVLGKGRRVVDDQLQRDTHCKRCRRGPACSRSGGADRGCPGCRSRCTSRRRRRSSPEVVLIVTSPLRWLPVTGSSDSVTSMHFSSPSKVGLCGGTSPGSKPEPSFPKSLLAVDPAAGAHQPMCRLLLGEPDIKIGFLPIRHTGHTRNRAWRAVDDIGQLRIDVETMRMRHRVTRVGDLDDRITVPGIFVPSGIDTLVFAFTRTFGKTRIEAPFSTVTSACAPPATTPRTSAVAHRPERNAFHFTVRIASSFPVDRTCSLTPPAPAPLWAGTLPMAPRKCAHTYSKNRHVVKEYPPGKSGLQDPGAEKSHGKPRQKAPGDAKNGAATLPFLPLLARRPSGPGLEGGRTPDANAKSRVKHGRFSPARWSPNGSRCACL